MQVSQNGADVTIKIAIPGVLETFQNPLDNLKSASLSSIKPCCSFVVQAIETH